MLSGGCTPPAPQQPPVPKTQMLSTTAQPSTANAPRDATPEARVVVQLDVYQLIVPAGAVSNNDSFWKHVSEENLDVVSRDVLYLNGVRVGEATAQEWSAFQTLIDTPGAVEQKTTCIAGDGRPLEMLMKKQVHDQCIFISNPPRDPEGRSYEECDNLIALSFWPDLRHAGDVRVKVCPLVRGMRKQLESTILEGSREFKYISPERLYDLKLDATVPLGSFMVIAPSECAKAKTSVGNAFLYKEGATERLEQVLLLVPRVGGMMTPVAKAK